MRDSGIRTELPLIPAASGCSCCATDSVAAVRATAVVGAGCGLSLS
ncbi:MULTISPECIES: hypothetical protein [Arthrobacter]|uniref:Uncharacterized protein n=2 Tax=Arthrobacter TaxID=1663 RepID=A0ABU9KKY5_9MICC|nr:hypothetical protein [Arthrobacter sp. YJM1]MDP5227557.1 hypothetical protein [Arthrobacter sp. YJM1]